MIPSRNNGLDTELWRVLFLLNQNEKYFDIKKYEFCVDD